MSDSLRELATAHYGKSPNAVRVDESTFPIYGTGGRMGFAKEPLFDGPLVVVARKGTLGNPTYSERACWVIDTAYAVVAKNTVDAKWLYYNLSNYDLESLNEATGVPSISRDYLYRISFHSTPLPQQRKIARILTTVDNLIEKTEALIAKYQAIKQGMMHDLFTRGVDEHGHLRPPYEEAPELYKQSELGWIPKEWSVIPGRHFCHEITKGATPPEMYNEAGLSNVPFIRVQNLSFDGTLLFDDQQLFIPAFVHQTSLVRSKVFPGDVLMNLVGPPMGKVSLVPDTYPEWNINQAIAIFRTIDASANVFLSHFLLSQFAFKWFISRAKRTSGQTNLTLEMCRQLPVPNPDDMNERIRITGLLNNADTRLVSENAVLTKLQRLKTGLMQDLLTGRVQVTADEAEEVVAHA